jgi:hypothetical protein
VIVHEVVLRILSDLIGDRPRHDDVTVVSVRRRAEVCV